MKAHYLPFTADVNTIYAHTATLRAKHMDLRSFGVEAQPHPDEGLAKEIRCPGHVPRLGWLHLPRQRVRGPPTASWGCSSACCRSCGSVSPAPLQSHTIDTGAQEIAAIVLASAVIAIERARVANGDVPVLRVCFLKMLYVVQAMWVAIELGEGVLTDAQIAVMLKRG